MNIKRIFSLALTLLLLLGTALPAHAAPDSLEIATAEDFLRFAESCRLDSYSRGLSVYLTADIDLQGADFQGVPYFAGRFYGGGHSISGFELTGEGSVQGFFRYIAQGAEVRELALSGSVTPGGSHNCVGGFVGENSGSITDCAFEGRVSGAEYVGGIAGKNCLTGTIHNCRTSGEISGSHFAGGLAGENLGVIRYAENRARVNTGAKQNIVALSDVTMDALLGSENAETVTDIGGIAGTSRGYIHDCVNRGDVGYRQMGYNIGGIAGSQMGYILRCENYGSIAGRKEVGGIVGQMEPTSFVRFERDALQTLSGQLDGLAGAAGQISANAEYAASAMGAHMGVLMGQIGETGMALGALMGDLGSVDQDTLFAAQSVLSAGLSNMSVTAQNMAVAGREAIGGISGSINALTGQINAMYETIGRAPENLGGSILDISDADTPEQTGGKVQDCLNMGQVSGDMNVGGLVGAMALENDLDVGEDVVLGDNGSLKFVNELRSVLCGSGSMAEVSAGHGRVGGVVGWMQLGLVRDCRATGSVSAGSADYAGGIAGKSESFIRSCSAKAEISGGAYVGGIAGEGSTVTGCRSMVSISGGERLGGVAGWCESRTGDEGQPLVLGNYYLGMGRDPGGIDGVSYEAVAQCLDDETFFALEGIPELFEKVTLRFVFEDGSDKLVSIAAGSRPAAEDIPAIPEKEGYLASWQGLEDREYDFDRSFHALYSPKSTTVESLERSEKGLPVLLAEGSFIPGSTLSLYAIADSPQLPGNERLMAAMGFSASDGGQAYRLRFYYPDAPESLKSYARMPDGSWIWTGCQLLGSYAAIDVPPGAEAFALSAQMLTDYQLKLIIGAATAVMFVLLVLIITGLVRKSRREKERALPEHT